MRIWTVAVILFISAALSQSVYAENLRSSEYAIESGVLDYQVENRAAEGNYNLSSSLGVGIQKRFRENGYVVYTFQHAKRADSYTRATLDQQQFAFREADKNGEATEHLHVVAVVNEGSSAVVSVFQEGEFASSFGQTIPPMPCNGTQRCSELSAVEWKNGFGFGYATDAVRFRPFFVGSKEHSRQAILSTHPVGNGRQVKVDMKLKPGSNMASGLYRSTLVITARGEF